MDLNYTLVGSTTLFWVPPPLSLFYIRNYFWVITYGVANELKLTMRDNFGYFWIKCFFEVTDTVVKIGLRLKPKQPQAN